MSRGPIQQAREAFARRLPATTKAGDRSCYMKLGQRRAYCGRKPKVAYDDWSRVTCSECISAGRADQQIRDGSES